MEGIPSKETVELMRSQYAVGTRVKLEYMNDVQAPSVGTLGTVTSVDDTGTIHVNWDNGSCLGLIIGQDLFKVID